MDGKQGVDRGQEEEVLKIGHVCVCVCVRFAHVHGEVD